MINAEQIRAARALLDWSTADLAKQAGLTVNGINKIERGHVQAHRETLEKLEEVFEGAGVEFIGERGAALRHDNYKLLEGSDCYLRLLDEVYQNLRNKTDAEVLFICVDDTISSPEVIKANNRIREAGIKCRYLCSEKAEKFDFDLNDYRVIPDQFYTNSVMVVFQNKVATLRGNNEVVLIVDDKEQSEMIRGLFEMIWRQSPNPKVRK